MSSKDKQPEIEPIDVTHEDIEGLKRDMRSARLTAWAEANRNNIMGAVVVVVLLLVGISLWKEHTVSQRASAATLYHQALNTEQQEDRRSMLQEIIKDYDNTVYGGLARLLLVNADADHAAEYLQALISRSDMDTGIRTQARLDLAQLKIDAGDKAAANKLLDTPAPADYEQLRQYLLAQAASDDAARIAHLQKARDAVSNDADLSRRIEQELSTLDSAAAGQG